MVDWEIRGRSGHEDIIYCWRRGHHIPQKDVAIYELPETN